MHKNIRKKVFTVFFIQFFILTSLFPILLSNHFNINTNFNQFLINDTPISQSDVSNWGKGIISDGTEPEINGTIILSEWEEAKLFNRTDTYKMMEIFIQRNSTHLFFGIIAYTTDDAPLLLLKFDEGDDGWRGSGSQDHALKENQDDFKAIWMDGNLADGTYDSGGGYVYTFVQIDYQAVTIDHGSRHEIEIVIPLVGVDGKAVDESDLNVTTTDIIGFDLNFIYDFDSKNSHIAGQSGDDFTYINLETMEMGIDTFFISIIPDGAEPNINGTIISSEWSNSLNFTYLDRQGRAKVYILRNSTHLMIAASFLDTVYDTDDVIKFLFDEGNDGGYGSGTRDENWIENQDDVKTLTVNELRDGHALSSGYTTSASDVDFVGFMNYYTDHWEVEMTMPLEGEEGKGIDYSDLTASVLDEIGLSIFMENETGWDHTYLPAHSTDYLSPRYFMKLKLGYFDFVQEESTKVQNGSTDKMWLNGTALSYEGDFNEIYVYPPNSDTTNATGVTWSTNQGTNESWAFYNTSTITEGIYWNKLNLSNDQGHYQNFTINYCIDFSPPTGNQDPATNASNPQNGGINARFWVNGTANDDLSGLFNVSVYDPASDTTNATGVTWSANQGTLSSWAFYNTSDVSEGEYWIKVKIEDKAGYYMNLTTNVSFIPNRPPVLSDASVNPSSGNVSSLFNFTVNYSDPDNNPPNFVYININNTSNKSMSKINTSDIDYIDGVMYTYECLLGNGSLVVDYYTDDGIKQVNLHTSPSVSIDRSITSSGLLVTPSINGAFTDFSEWNDSTTIYNPDVDPSFYLYLKNDDDYLYACVDVVGDDTMIGLYDYVEYFFDINNDNLLKTEDIKIYHRDGGWERKYFWNETTESWELNGTLSGTGIILDCSFAGTVNSGASHATYEIRIPLSFLNVSEGETIGFGLHARRAVSRQSYFPANFNTNNATSYSDLLLNLTLNYPEISLIEPTNKTYSINSVPIICENTTNVEYVWVRNRTSGSWSDNVSLSYNTTHWVNSTTIFWPNNVYQLQVFANDSLGLESMILRYFTIDTIKPLISIISPLNDTFISSPTTWINGSVNSTGSSINSISLNSSQFEIVDDPTTAVEGLFSFRNNTNILGNFTLNVTVTDDAGWMNYSIVSFAVDNTYPNITISSPLVSAVSGDIWINGTVNGTGSQLILYYNDSRFDAIINPNASIASQFALNNNTVIPDGNFTINLTVIDSIPYKVEYLLSFYIDNSNPDILITNIANGSSISNPIIWINGTINSTGSLISSFNINDTNNFSIHTNPSGLEQGNFAIWNSTPLDNDIYSLAINSTDLAGHTNTTIIYFQVINEQPNPTIQLITPAYNLDAIGGNNLTIKGNVAGISSDISHVWVNSTGSFNWSLLVNPSGTSGGIYIFVNASPIADGLHGINITVNNTVGNFTSLIRSFYIDNTLPITPPNIGKTLSGNSVTIFWDDVGDVTNVTYIIERNGVNLDNITVLNYTDTNLAPGTYTYRVYAIDNAGNICATAAIITVSISGSGGDPWSNLLIIILVLAIICGGVVIAVTIRISRSRRNKSIPSGKKKLKGKQDWTDNALGYSSDLNKKLSKLTKKPQKFDQIKDPTLLEFLKNPFTHLSSIVITKLEQMPISDNEKIEILRILLPLTPPQREQLITELIEDIKGEDS